MYVFGYGSLINRASISRTLGREVLQDQLIEAELVGYARRWTVADQVYSEARQQVVRAAFLDVLPQQGSGVWGVMVNITEQELRHLRQRERNYECVSVAGAIPQTLDSTSVVTFVSLPQYRVTADAADVFVLDGYQQIVDDGVAAMGTLFAQRYQDTTEDHRFALLSGDYSFSDRPDTPATPEV